MSSPAPQATIEVSNIRKLSAEMKSHGVEIACPLPRQAWGGQDFHIRDSDGNRISFVEYGGTA